MTHIGVWCWIDDDRTDTTALRFGIWYGPLFLLILLLFVSNGYIFSKVNREVTYMHGTLSVESVVVCCYRNCEGCVSFDCLCLQRTSVYYCVRDPRIHSPRTFPPLHANFHPQS